jgi:hypothetical protein
MKLTWESIHGDLCAALPSEPDNILAHVWNYEGWRMSCAFGTTDEEGLTYSCPEAAQLHAQELIDGWVERHTWGWKSQETESIYALFGPEIFVVYGPPASGKTLNAKAAAYFLGCDLIVDAEDLGGHTAAKRILVLTHDQNVEDYRLTGKRKPRLEGRRIHISTIKQILGSKWVEPKTEGGAKE